MNKSQLKRLAAELRREVDVSPHERFDPYELAELYGIDVIPLSELACDADAMHHFTVDRPEVFSGALIPCSDGSTVIVENDTHLPERRVSTASHEISHVVLEHPFSATLTDSGKCRVMNKEHEDEAAELSGELLLPTEAARRLAYNKVGDEEVARRFGISVQFASWRMNATGARKIAQRAHAKRA
ncbi:ImmA/IrrE family metallo-endopeptidase [Nocardioides sp. cx-173]|uniref:ImmA/IrrE family metallo-endopeptidase n=1 Tax=Nocardioides sp. cx-173 TaxID=2898796 RepID=UPI001E3B340A|nr:ImmA/IrrE family metallo-endopeptidase [Nocardioides sp. cx-173]MCD4527228.1 ImmA/IrrE family metallo-endopeptidase [Nocardioides sp. cx-173]UGB40415.1 ImmA/IrrE family metallo-endopeptidase [Nocardioides sp. cx-173]